MAKDIIRFENVSFSYDENTPVFNNLNLSVKEGSYTVLLGHNGSGKSTIAKLIIGLLEKENGNIYVNDLILDEKNLDEIRNHVAIVFQNPDNQFIGSTVEDDIAFGLENKCVDPKEMDKIILKYATKVNMQDYLKNEPSNLSGGQKQRVAIAGVLAMHPDILILDEATSMLDPLGRKEIFNVILDLKKKNPKMTILSITHHIEEALQADEIILLNDGKVNKVGKPIDILYDFSLLEENHLLAPFVVSLNERLKKEGIDLGNCLTIDDMVDKL